MAVILMTAFQDALSRKKFLYFDWDLMGAIGNKS